MTDMLSYNFFLQPEVHYGPDPPLILMPVLMLWYCRMLRGLIPRSMGTKSPAKAPKRAGNDTGPIKYLGSTTALTAKGQQAQHADV